MNNPRTTECPACQGEGRLLKETSIRLSGARFAERDWVDDGPCPDCDGQGTVNACNDCGLPLLDGEYSIHAECLEARR